MRQKYDIFALHTCRMFDILCLLSKRQVMNSYLFAVYVLLEGVMTRQSGN